MAPGSYFGRSVGVTGFLPGEIKCATLCSQSRSSWQSQRSREPHVPTWSVPLLERVRALWLRVLSVRSRAGLLEVCLVGHIGDRQLAIAGSTTVSVALLVSSASLTNDPA